MGFYKQIKRVYTPWILVCPLAYPGVKYHRILWWGAFQGIQLLIDGKKYPRERGHFYVCRDPREVLQEFRQGGKP